jgi:hypothetical protein
MISSALTGESDVKPMANHTLGETLYCLHIDTFRRPKISEDLRYRRTSIVYECAFDNVASLREGVVVQIN